MSEPGIEIRLQGFPSRKDNQILSRCPQGVNFRDEFLPAFRCKGIPRLFNIPTRDLESLGAIEFQMVDDQETTTTYRLSSLQPIGFRNPSHGRRRVLTRILGDHDPLFQRQIGFALQASMEMKVEALRQQG